MNQATSILIAGDFRTEKAVKKHRPSAKIVGVLKDLALIEYVSSEMIVDEIIIDPQLSPRGETLEQWAARFTKTFPQIAVTILGSGLDEPNAVSKTTNIITPQTVVVWSPKGGVGKTFISTNLACAAATATQGKAALIDFDVYSGDVATYLDLADTPTIIEMLPKLQRLRPDGLEKYVQIHGASRLSVICSPKRPELSNLITVEHVNRVFSLAARRWGLLYVDTAPNITSGILSEAIDIASAIVFVVTQDVCALRQGKVALDIFRKLGIPQTSIYVVLNRGCKDAPVSERKVEEYLETSLAAIIPEDRKIVEKSVFQGKPAVLYSGTEISSAIWKLLSKISPGLSVPEVKKKGKRKRRFRLW